MTSPALPYQFVDAPTFGDYRYGIYSVAPFTDPADQKQFWAGVEFEPQCPQVPMKGTRPEACPPPGTPAKVLDRGIPLEHASVFRLYTGVLCDASSLRTDWEERATTAVERSEQQTLEYALWTGVFSNRPRLADPATPVVLSGQDLRLTLGTLEQEIAKRFGAGIIWAPRWTAPYFAEQQLLMLSGTQWRTTAGTPVVFSWLPDAGIGPTGALPAAGSAWLYATGPAMVRRSRVLLPDLAAALNRETNDVFMIAERSYVAGFACGAIAAMADLNPA